ncbi:hypothetical protein BD560DRAFT_329007 [Blakeslea trispora]|nr:hypothetical protein BD560DRAFT_329007 [Blakeslea trispora]
MAKIEESTKRRSSDLEEQSVTPRPPPKKRFLSRASSPEDSEDENASDAFDEPLESFRKDAITRQWKEYTRLLERCKKNVEQMETIKTNSEEYLRLWEDSFRQLQTFLLHTIQSGLSTFGHAESAVGSDQKSFEHLLNQEWTSDIAKQMVEVFLKKKSYDMTLTKFNKLVDVWIRRRENIIHGFEPAFEQGALRDLRKDQERILHAWSDSQRLLQDMKNRYKSANIMTRTELRSVKQDSPEHEFEDVKTTTPSANTSFVPTTPSTPLEQKFDLSNTQGDSAARIQQALDQRLRDIELMKEDRIGLKQQVARLEMDLVCVPESRIYKAPICRNLSQSRAYYKDKCNRLSDLCHDIQLRMDDLSGNRRQLIKQLDTEQVDHYSDMENQLRKLDDDLTRIRAQRDALQMQFEIGKVSSEAGRASVIELKLIADTRKEHVAYLETELLRLQKKMIARTGNKEFYHLLLNHSEEHLLEPIQVQLNQLEQELEIHKQRLYTQNEQVSVNQQWTELTELLTLQAEIAAFEAKYGFHPSSPVNVVQKVLQDRIERERQFIVEAKQKLVNLEATERQLLSEIESASLAYGDLEQETINRVKDLASVEDEVIRLQAERVKYTQTFTSLNKSKDANTMVMNALTKQIEKQLTHIKQLTEREKNLGNQLICLERELNANHAVYDVYKQKNDEAKLTLSELKEKTTSSKDKIAELQKSILEKIRQTEEGAHSRLRKEESCELLKRKVETIDKSDRPAESKLKKEREEYRVS